MKNIVLAIALTVATAAAANAQTAAAKPQAGAKAQPATPAAPAAPSAHAAKAPAAAKASTMKAEVVSTDATAKTITVKDAAGASTTLTATGGAVASLANLKAGDWVTVTKSENNATRITKAKAKAAGHAAKKADKPAKSSTK